MFHSSDTFCLGPDSHTLADFLIDLSLSSGSAQSHRSTGSQLFLPGAGVECVVGIQHLSQGSAACCGWGLPGSTSHHRWAAAGSRSEELRDVLGLPQLRQHPQAISVANLTSVLLYVWQCHHQHFGGTFPVA